jgi:hypothetical protein
MLQGEAMRRRVRRTGRGLVCRQLANQRRQVFVAGRLLCVRECAQRGRLASRHPQGGKGAGVAHHHPAHQLAQPVAVCRLARFARHHVNGPELLLRLEDARLQQGQQVVQFEQAVLYGRRGQQQQETLLQAVHQTIAGTALIAQMMRLVDDHHVVAQSREQVRLLLAACRGDGGDHPLLCPEADGVAAQQRVVRGGAVDAELARHFVAPLPDQRGGREDQDALGHAAQHVFLQHHPRLDGLAEPDLVGEQDPAAILFQHLADRLDLIPMRLDALQCRQAEQFVEPFEETQPDKLATQPERARVGARFGAGDLDCVFIGQLERDVEPRLQPGQVGDRRGWRGNRGGRARGRADEWGRTGRPTADGQLWRTRRSGRPRGPLRHLGPQTRPTNVVQAAEQPILHDVVADEPSQRGMIGVKLRLLQQRPGLREMSLLAECEAREQSDRIARHVAFAVPLEQGERPLGLARRQGGQGRQQQQLRIDRPCPQPLLGDVHRLR